MLARVSSPCFVCRLWLPAMMCGWCKVHVCDNDAARHYETHMNDARLLREAMTVQGENVRESRGTA